MTTKKLCTYAGCNKTVDHANDNTSPRCAKHLIKPLRKHYEHHHINGKNIYKSTMWKRVRRARVLLSPLCVMCLNDGIATPVAIVDHIIEIEDGGEPFNINNTQSLCRKCHNGKTGMTRKSRNKLKPEYPTLSNFK